MFCIIGPTAFILNAPCLGPAPLANASGPTQDLTPPTPSAWGVSVGYNILRSEVNRTWHLNVISWRVCAMALAYHTLRGEWRLNVCVHHETKNIIQEERTNTTQNQHIGNKLKYNRCNNKIHHTHKSCPPTECSHSQAPGRTKVPGPAPCLGPAPLANASGPTQDLTPLGSWEHSFGGWLLHITKPFLLLLKSFGDAGWLVFSSVIIARLCS